MKANIGLNENDTKVSVKILEKILASENVMNIKIRNYHWNIIGINFSESHKFFEELYDESAENIDEIAERIRILGEKTQANMKFFLEKSFISEEESLTLSFSNMATNLLSDKETMIKEIRKAIEIISKTEDSGTEDFLIALIQKHEKNAWMLRSMIK